MNFEGSVHCIQLSKVRQVVVLLFRYFGILCPYKLKRIWREIFMIYDVVMIVSLFWESFMEFCRWFNKKEIHTYHRYIYSIIPRNGSQINFASKDVSSYIFKILTTRDPYKFIINVLYEINFEFYIHSNLNQKKS